VTQSRTPFRLALEELTETFAQAVLDAVRDATIRQLLEIDAPPVRRAARTTTIPAPLETPPEPTNGAAVVRPRKPRTERRTDLDEPSRAISAPPESALAAGTEIDALAMLASLEPQTAAFDTPAVAERPAPMPAEPPIVEPPAIVALAPQPGEDLLHTATGSIVLRRRRTS